VTRAGADAGFTPGPAVHGAVPGLDIAVVERADRRPGFVPVNKRWMVRRVYGRLMPHRGPARGYASRPGSSVSPAWWASMASTAGRWTGHQHPDLATRTGSPRHLDTILGLITERGASAARAADRVREQITALTAGPSPRRP
jgi:hypothetical protein